MTDWQHFGNNNSTLANQVFRAQPVQKPQAAAQEVKLPEQSDQPKSEAPTAVPESAAPSQETQGPEPETQTESQPESPPEEPAPVTPTEG